MAQPEDVRELISEIGDQSILPDDFAVPAPGSGVGGGYATMNSLQALFSARSHNITADDRVPGWWSPWRDQFLFKTMLDSDVLSSAIFSTTARLVSVPVHIRARDKENRNHRRISMWSDLLLNSYWQDVAFAFAMDWQTQDNGAFMEIQGAGDPGGPIEPTQVPGTKDWIYGTGLRVLDSQNCTRTGDPEYPVVYKHRGADGRTKYYRFHHTRIIFRSQMASSRADMYDVGLCGASRCVRNVIRLDDIRIFEDELLGVRPLSQLIFGKAISAENMEKAFVVAEEKGANGDKRRVSQLVFMGVTGNPELVKAADIKAIDLKHYPDGYNQETSMNLAINVISMGLGFDPRELWPATVRGATRADAEVQHWKSMMKTPGLWINGMTKELCLKWCPTVSVASFDQQDDEQARSRADLRYVRAQTREIDLRSGALDQEATHQLMLEDGDVSESMFMQLRQRAEEMAAQAEQARQDALAAGVQDGQGDAGATAQDGNTQGA